MKLVNSLKRGGEYDCVVPISGGKDSVFILRYAVKELGLRAVAVNYNSGMQSDLAIENMKNACDILHVPLIFKKADEKLQTRRLEAMLRLSERLGSFVLGCGGCVPVLQSATISFANENNIPIVLDGGSSLEHVPSLKDKGQGSIFKAFAERFKNGMKPLFRYKLYDLDVIKYAYLFRYRKYDKRLKRAMGVFKTARPPLGYVDPFISGRAAIIRFSNYIMMPEAEMVRIIKQELKWKNPEGTDKRFDCLLHCLFDFDHLSRYGITSNGVVYSNMIRQGLMDREDALRKETRAKENIFKECGALCERLGLREYKMPSL
ncbi:MAG: hypothetical protein WC569_04925 [Candidatus Omnitrophota bacterium]